MLYVLAAQSHSLATAETLVEAHAYPAHQLWGLDAMRRHSDWAVRVVGGSQHRHNWPASRLRSADAGVRNHREFARRTPRNAPSVAYAARAQVTAGLALGRTFGVWRHPLVSIFHNPVSAAWPIAGAWSRGVDLALALSATTHESLLQLPGRITSNTRLVQWGPDLAFRGYVESGQDVIVSTGKDNRDLPTLLAALNRGSANARVYAPRNFVDDPRLSATTTLVRPPAGAEQSAYSTVLEDLCRASIVAIPVARLDRLTGLSEVNDALALSKPIIMTRTPHFDLDLEGIGCGLLVEPGDIDGWAAAISALSRDRERRVAMGRAGRAFAEEHWNYELFCQQVVSAVEDAAA